jgi:hypothetical protein
MLADTRDALRIPAASRTEIKNNVKNGTMRHRGSPTLIAAEELYELLL